ncbi:Ig-like domain-containing protein [Exiguobacterium sp. CinTr1]|uniref:Ig-like domain-containing protein n=2 Tax=unclassified Exiguobacterium TaxID=2644629 RepID=UPI0022E2FAAB|nr:Ig-like domain-containing protein [Exiguobacterium sp. CinTr1]
MNKKSIIKQTMMILMVMILLVSTLSPVEASGTLTVQAFEPDSKMLMGQTSYTEPLYYGVDQTIRPVSVKSDGTFTVSLAEAVGERIVTFYQKDDVYYKPVQRVSASVIEKGPIPPNFYGVESGKMQLQSNPGYEIIAIYDGETYRGVEVLSIPKKQGNEVKAYTKASNGKRSVTGSYSFDDSFDLPIQVDSMQWSQSRVHGTTLPYQNVRLTLYDRTLSTVSDATGHFEVKLSIPFDDYIKGLTGRVEVLHPNNEVLVEKEVKIDPVRLTSEQPYYSIAQSFGVYGVTDPDMTVTYDGEKVTVDESGLFYISLRTDGTSHKTITYKKDGTVLAEQSIRQYVDSTFPLTIEATPSTVSGKLSGETEPNAKLFIRSDNGDFSVQADSNGKFSTELPLFESGVYEFYLQTDFGMQRLSTSISVKEERMIAEPTVRFLNETMYIEASLPDREAEVQIMRKNGEIEVARTSLYEGKGEVHIPYGSTYRLRVSTGEQVSPYVDGIHQAMTAPTLTRFIEGEKVVSGHAEPNATVVFYNRVQEWNPEGTRMEVKTGTDGAFSFTLQQELKKWTYRFAVESSDKKNITTYEFTPKDETAPNLTINGQPNTTTLSEMTETVRVQSDDLIDDLKVEYFTNGAWETVDSISRWRYAFDFKPNTGATFKEAGVSQIRIQVVNPNGLKRVVTLTVKDITPPSLVLDRLLYGDQVISGKTDPLTLVRFGRTGDVTQRADETGRFSFKLDYPVSKYSMNLFPVTVVDEVGNKRTLTPDVFDYRIEDVRINAGGTKLWLANETRRISYSAYDLIVNGQKINLSNYDTTINLPEPVSYPVNVELRLRNEDSTVRYTFSKTLQGPSTLTTPKNLKASSDRRTITGQLDPYISFDIYDKSGKRITSNRAKADGSFAVAIVRPLVANESLRIVSKDAFGQTKSMTFKVADKTPPVKPTIQQAVVPLKQVTGKAEAGATVRVTYRGKTYTTKADSKGIYRLNVSNWLAGQKISVTARDVAGNTSSATTIVILKAFRTASVSAIRTTSTFVSGKADAGASVKVYANNRQVGKTTRVGSSQSFKIAIPKQKKGTKMTVRIYRAGYATVERKLTVY